MSDANAILEELGKPGSLEFVEGNLDFPLLPEYIASGSEVTTNDENSESEVTSETTTSAADALKNMLGDSINIEGE